MIGLTRTLITAITMVILFGSHLLGLDPGKKSAHYLVDQWLESDGIPTNTVLSISQTPDGYLWLATKKGLLRFDGMHFSNIPFNEKEKTDYPTTLFVDRNGILWIGSEKGLTSYNHKTGRFKTFTSHDGLTNEPVRRIKDDLNGNLWISFRSSFINRFSNGAFNVLEPSEGLTGNVINAILVDDNGNLLLGSSEKGVFIYKDRTISPHPDADIKGSQLIAMIEDSKGELWIGTTTGLFRVNDECTQKYTTSEGLSNNRIHAIMEDQQGNLWIATEKGLNRVKRKQGSKIAVQHFLKEITFISLFEDKEKSIWAATLNSGLIRLKQGIFTSYGPFETKPDEMFCSLYRDQQGYILIGAVNGKLSRYQDEELKETIPPQKFFNASIIAIHEDTEGTLWLGTMGKGVFQKKKNSLEQFNTNKGLSSNRVTSIFEDSRKDLWFSTFDGVSVWRSTGNNIESLTSKNGLSGKRVHNVHEDINRNIWIAAEKGITILGKGKIPPKDSKQEFQHYLEGTSVTWIYEDRTALEKEGLIYWISTRGNGLKRLRLKDGNITTYTTDQGMTTNNLSRFFEDSQGNFWFMSDSGVLRVSKQELNLYAAKELTIINCISFGTDDGLNSSEFNDYFSRNSAIKNGEYELWFLTTKGISILDTAKFKINQTPPPVLLQSINIDGEPVPLQKNVFKVKNRISIGFTAIIFLSPEKVKFKYLLKGKDKNWVFLPCGNERVAHYRDLSPGDYTFSVTACNAHGVWNKNGASFYFTIKPYFYQTLVFKLSILALFIVLLIAVVYIYIGIKEKKKGKYKGINLELDFIHECIIKLENLMKSQKLYRIEKLTLPILAEKLSEKSVNAHRLSYILNEHIKCSFPDYINGYRVEEAKRILVSPQGDDMTIGALAREVGFNTEAAFYKAFKKLTGKTPKQWKTENQKEDKV